MIKEITLDKIATYRTPTKVEPLMINYFYGSNGCGKTTVSKLIANPALSENCFLKWDNDTELDRLVYNNDFVNDNFTQSAKLKGIFTLGKDAKDAQKFIDESIAQVDVEKKEIEKLRTSWTKLDEQEKEEKKDLEETCWKTKRKYENDFKGAFQGYIGSKESFADKCINEMNNNTVQILKKPI